MAWGIYRRRPERRVARRLSAALFGAPPATGTLSASLPAPTLTGAATVAVVGTLNTTMPAPTLSGAATVAVNASLNANTPAPTLTGAAVVAVTATLNANLLAPTLEGVANVAATIGTLSASLPAPTISGTATVAVTASATPSMPAPTLTGAAAVAVTATLSANLPAPTLSATGLAGIAYGTLSASLPAPTLAATAVVTGEGTVVVATTGGGWIDPRVARQLLRRAQAYQKDVDRLARKPREEREAAQAAMTATIERVYAEITGEPLPAADVVAARLAEPTPEAKAPARVVQNAIAVYGAVVKLDDRKAMADAVAALDKAIMQLRIAAEEDDEIVLLLAAM